MRRIVSNVIPAVLMVMTFAVALHAETKYGAGVTIEKATPIHELYASPEKFVGKTVRIDGVVTAVCTEMGCWMAIGATDNPDRAVRFQADVKIGAGDHEAKEAAGEHAHSQPKAAEFGNQYQFKVTGAVAP
jgi:hypothetical protein